MYKILELNIGETQFSFRDGLGTREALPSLNVLAQRRIDMTSTFIRNNEKSTRRRIERCCNVHINNIRYADDTILIASSLADLEVLLDKVNENNQCTEEIKTKIGRARATFLKMKIVFCSSNLSLDLKIRLVRCYLLSVLFYGGEAWTLKGIEMKSLDDCQPSRRRRPKEEVVLPVEMRFAITNQVTFLVMLHFVQGGSQLMSKN
ncbi:hypothetical protein HUJ04_008274 [Dendroctonus ponderosae]|nr:hypothetical protein HUJ04_008274 [Dendroctonus ponderosae]KAH1008152.1 hypothetical protein HUJ05_008733 [Dendroctonus ponderosae]